MDKKYLKETSEMFLDANLEDIRESECMFVKVTDIYKIAENFLGEDHVSFIADYSNGEAQDSLRKCDLAQELINYNPELSIAIKDAILIVNALRKRHMEIEEEEDRVEKILEALEEEEDAIKAQLNQMGLIAEEEDEEEDEEVYLKGE